ncbi:MAG: hypothetical protein H8D96_01725 [Desulfobacterales bacterium]|uniref:Uncharacterized protein n=1 Tax=Candidatus Desulfatibia vada TaxID=2841696 RepID=A0A8J6NVI8_9BACT|nr:hypothetical protein [Candidatus Desulfatibia vada]
MKKEENGRFQEILREINFCSKLAVPLKPFDMLGKKMRLKNILVLIV